ncbi:DUF7507 domain-containing protein [Phyllobacterium myrsinacearum]|uniref:Putative repeat protein (TIGR01451 family) n=1 Tax=Phyllobacterium myrsinacearum TaxID=28101 RepID=A0A839EKF4_9HYPH|nr:DUF11 domain-containing protein [Phyllobacterium myrsinacearum]MBA8880913.1 putative repeat protein (TIGR01451 family) [Phyllobacterium myrsinacearum]
MRYSGANICLKFNSRLSLLFALILALFSVGLSESAFAQVQRSFINQGFESPALGTTGCYKLLAQDQVPGWKTTHPNAATGGDCSIVANPTTGPLIEMWRSGFQGVPSAEGSQFAELNANESSRLYQNVCLVNGEQFSWRFSHRRRAASGTESLSFNIAPTATGTRTNITTSAANAAGWFNRSGTYTYNGGSGVQTLGFESLNAGSFGNFLDNIQITLTPYIEFQPGNGSGAESIATANLPTIRVAGTLTSAITVQVTVAGTATLGTDYTTPSGTNTFSVTVPAGDYNGAQGIATGVSVVNDTQIEPNKTIQFTMTANPGSYTIAGTQTCGAAANGSATYTILDDDARLTVTKALTATRVAAADQFALTIAGSNGPVTANTTGAGAAANGQAQLSNIAAGSAYTLSEAMASGSSSPIALYGGTIACTNARVGGTTVLPSGAGTSFSVTPTAGDDITCTFTNTPKRPSMTMVKSAGTPTGTTAGSTIQYSFTITNTGDVPLSPLSITDPKLNAAATCPSAPLAPGATAVCTGIHTITQAEIDAGTVNNSATATGTPPGGATPITTPPSTTTTSIAATGALTVLKAAGAPSGNTAGSTIAYTFTVTNTGNVALKSIVVTDPKIPAPGPTCPVTELAPNVSTICTGTHTITQTEVDAAKVDNSATVRGTPPTGNPVTAGPSTTSTPLTRAGSVTIVKTAGSPTGNAAGSTVAYSFRVQNTGNVTLTNLVINDAKLDAPGATCAQTTLAPNAVTTCTGTHSITQAEIDAGTSSNTASATTTGPDGNPVNSITSTVNTPLTRSASLTVAKVAGAPTGASAGSTIPYTFTVRNTGNVTLTAVVINDAQLNAAATCVATTLVPNTSTTCTGTHTITQAEVNAGTSDNSATASGAPPTGGAITSPPSTTTTPLAGTPALTVDKSAGTPTSNAAGGTIAYTFVVKNTGNVTLTSVGINDAKLSSPATCPVTTLQPGDSTTCTGTHTITQAEVDAGTADNTATANGTPPTGPKAISGPDGTSTPLTRTSSIAIAKSAGAPTGNTPGSTITYSFRVENTGNVTLTTIGVNDSKLTTAPVCAVTILAPGANTTCTGTYTITQVDINAGKVDNSATSTGTSPTGPVTSTPSTTSTPITQSKSIAIVKSAGTPTGNAAGATVPYTFTVTNTGNITLRTIAISDVNLDSPGATCTVTELAPGADTTCTGTHTITQAEVNAGKVTNSATVNGTPPSGPVITGGPSTAETPLTRTPALTVDKVAGTPTGSNAGATISYTFKVVNTGNVTLTGLGITDPKLNAPGATCPVTTLAPGADTTCTGVHTVTQDEVNAGTVNNSATATGTSPTGTGVTSPPDTTATPITRTPDLTILKTASPATGNQVGDTITYSFRVENTGNVTLTNVRVTDLLPNVVLAGGPIPTFVPGAVDTTTFTATYTLVQADIEAGVVNNSATAKGTPQGGGAELSSTPSTTSTPITAAPALSLVKRAAAPSGNTALSTIAYSFTVTNTGNVLITNITINDSKLTNVVCNATSLVPEAVTTCTGTYTIDQTEVNAGVVINTATASGIPSRGTSPVTSNPSSTTTPIAAAPAITLVKTAGVPSGNTAGSTILYTFTVQNTGNLPLTNVNVTDPLVAVPGGSVSLAPNATQVFTATYVLTQADVNRGEVVNTAQTSGQTAGGATVNDSDSVVVRITQAPALSLIKTHGAPSGTNAGATIPYTFTLTNTGNLPLTNVTVTESLPGVVLTGNPIATLAVDETKTVTGIYTITQADINAGHVTNSATASGTDTNSATVPSLRSSTDTPLEQKPSVAIVKDVVAGTPAQNRAGSKIDYTFVVTNNGNVPLTNISVSDGKLDATATCPVTSLAPGAETTCTGSHTLTQADVNAGKVTNTATAAGETAGGNSVVSPPSTVEKTILEEGALVTEKTAATPTGNTAGSIVRYTFKVTNTGNIPLTLVKIVDPKIQPIISGGPYTMQPGEVRFFTADYTLTQDDAESGAITNTAHSTGTTPSGKEVIGSNSTANVSVPANAALTIVKSAGTLSGQSQGSILPYTFTVTNTGNVQVTGIVVHDAKIASITCDKTTLDPKDVAQCTGNYPITQADVNAGVINNTANATGTPSRGGPTVTSTDSDTSTPIKSAPGISLDKSAGTPTGSVKDSTVPYTFTVRNIGNVTLTDIAVSDSKLTVAPICAATSLEPGISTTCTGTYTLTQADVNAGTVVNEATATGTPPTGSAITADDEATVHITAAPALKVEKFASAPSGNTVGSTINYTFRIENTGNVTLTNVALSDQLAGVVLSGGPIATFEPGIVDTSTFTAKYTLKQEDVDGGYVTNTVTGSGAAPNGSVVKGDATVTSSITPAGGISLVKTAGPPTGNTEGSTIAYTFTVKNTGNVTLKSIAVTDTKLLSPPVCVATELAPNATTTCTGTYTLMQPDVNAGTVNNSATVKGTPPSGPDVSNGSSVVTPIPSAAAISVVKTAGPPSGHIVGSTIDYTFAVKNTGNVTLRGITLNDTLAGVVLTGGPIDLDPGKEDTTTFKARYTLKDQTDIDDGKVDNEVTASGKPDNSAAVTAESAVSTPITSAPAMTVEKIAGTPSGNTVGSTIGYTFKITNTGNVTLKDITLSDQMAGVVLSGGPLATLNPAAVNTTTFSAVYTLTQADIDHGSVTNKIIANGLTPDNKPVTANGQVTTNITADAKISLKKIAGVPSGNKAGDSLTFTFTVKNEGNVTLKNITLADPLLGAEVKGGPIKELLPTQEDTTTFTAAYKFTQADIDARKIENTATVTGTPPMGAAVSASSTAIALIAATPALTMVKQATSGDPYTAVGGKVTYQYVVTNTGNVTITQAISVTDDKIAAVSCPALPTGGLVPKATLTCAGTYTVIQADLDAGTVTNKATATDGTTTSPVATATVKAALTAGLSVEKKAGTPSGNTVGSTIDYTFVVKNTGNVTVKGITLDDSLPNIVLTGGPIDLAPGLQDTTTFKAQYTLTQADLNTGKVVNTATVTGSPATGGNPFTSPPSQVTTPVTPNAALTVVKTAGTPSGNTVGSTIDYTFTITNTGNVDLTNVTVADTLPNVVLTGGPIALLTPGQTDSTTITARYALTQADLDSGQVANSATASGTPSSGGTAVTSAPSSTVSPIQQNPKIEVTKAGKINDVNGNGFVDAEDTITYTFVVKNSGNVVVNDIAPLDAGPTFNGRPAANKLSAFSSGPAAVAPGQNHTFTATYKLAQSDVDDAAGVKDGVLNKATARGYYKGGATGGTAVDAAEAKAVLDLPAAQPSDVTITKQAGLRQIRRGEKAPFTIKVTNKTNSNVGGVNVIDRMPSGFRYVDGSASINGVAVTPVINGLNVLFENIALGPKAEVVIRLQMLALSTAGPGKHVNRARVTGPGGNTLAPEASAAVEIVVEPVFDCGDIVGKVFDDLNSNGYQDEGEPGLPGVRVATVRGLLITTDKFGRFHVACADLPDSRIGSNFIMKLDPRTLPTGYRLTTENPRVIRLTAGKMSSLNFGASLGRVVRLDLKDEAFQSGNTILKEQWDKGIDQLIVVLKEKPSTLRISYVANSDTQIAKDRMDAIQEEIAKRWKSAGGDYELNIETRVEAGK